ncbi:unnamed protein product [Gongylonema pulchrum]|uniref:Kinesin motor domain-containing protein n=1 Tax=Gongylonema pulchrum TaxID=637853 RepID=A0A183DZ69_9BILA|nr:unnamed protein product [Gongylonema pulchrum]
MRLSKVDPVQVPGFDGAATSSLSALTGGKVCRTFEEGDAEPDQITNYLSLGPPNIAAVAVRHEKRAVLMKSVAMNSVR